MYQRCINPRCTGLCQPVRTVSTRPHVVPAQRYESPRAGTSRISPILGSVRFGSRRPGVRISPSRPHPIGVIRPAGHPRSRMNQRCIRLLSAHDVRSRFMMDTVAPVGGRQFRERTAIRGARGGVRPHRPAHRAPARTKHRHRGGVVGDQPGWSSLPHDGQVIPMALSAVLVTV